MNVKSFLKGWLLITFADSILFINGGIYVSRWLVEDIGAPTYLYNLVIGASVLLVFLFSFLIGRLVDKHGPTKPLSVSVVIMCVSALIMSFAPFFMERGIVMALTISFLFLLVLTFDQLSLIAHNSFLLRFPLSTNIKKYSSSSSISNWLGSIFGIFLTFGFVGGYFISGLSGNEAAFVPASIVTLLLAFFGIYLIKKSSPNNLHFVKENSSLKNKLSSYFKNRFYLLYILGSFFLIDVIFTIQLNLSQMMLTVHSVGEKLIAPLFLVILVGAAVGGFVNSNFSKGYTFRIFISSLIFAFLILGVVFIPFTFILYSLLFFFSGFFVGVLEPALREGYSHFLTIKDAGVGFSVYNLLGRSSVILGPLIFSILLYFLEGKLPFQIGFVIFSVFSIFGGILIYFAKKRGIEKG